MQIFLPYPDINKSAQCLDRLRLGKQRVEAMTIAKTILGESTAWQYHPAVKMVKNHPSFLFAYWACIVKEWVARGYQDNTMKTWHELQAKYGIDKIPKAMPSWFGNEQFHKSHQSNLLRKDFDYYSQFFPNVPNNLPYVWPI